MINLLERTKPIAVTPESLASMRLPPLTQPLTVLSHGLGQDSAALLALIISDPSFRTRYVKGELLCLNADTSDEHADTEAYAIEVARQCESQDISFYRIGSEWRSNAWRDGHIAQFRRTHTIGLRTMRSCTDNLKITPIYRALDQYLGQRLGVPFGRKRALREYAERFGKLTVMIGFAKGEERRARRANIATQLNFNLRIQKLQNGSEPLWMSQCIDRIYPLIDLGMDREMCQQYIARTGLPTPLPSNCRRCHHSRPEDILRISLAYPEQFMEWCELEDAKVAAWEGRVAKNDRVFGEKSLREVAENARQQLLAEHGPMTDTQMIERLTALRFSRGHCVSSSM